MLGSRAFAKKQGRGAAKCDADNSLSTCNPVGFTKL